MLGSFGAELRDYLGNAEFHLVESDEGHDGFLIEQNQVGPLLQRFLLRVEGERGLRESHELRSAVTKMEHRISILEKMLADSISKEK
eukprot:SAG31_NODE_8866_length_1371_cov_1.105346_1_plen_87_part_00